MLKVGARSSPLSFAQVDEIKKEYGIDFEVIWVETTGDQDKTTSLKGLEKTDFFTKELDQMLLEGKIDAAIHSAKDLPDPNAVLLSRYSLVNASNAFMPALLTGFLPNNFSSKRSNGKPSF